MTKYIIDNQEDFKVFLDENFPPNFLRNTIINDYGLSIDLTKEATDKIELKLRDILHFFLTKFNIDTKLTTIDCVYYLYNLI